MATSPPTSLRTWVSPRRRRSGSRPRRPRPGCPMSDGAAAVVLTADRAAVRVAGIGQGTDTLAVRHRDTLTSFRASRAAASAAFAMAGFGPERVALAELHDAFAPFELRSEEHTSELQSQSNLVCRLLLDKKKHEQ